MKPRYHGMLSTGIVLCTLGAVAAYWLTGYWRSPAGGGVTAPSPALAALHAPSDAQVRTMQSLQERLADLAFPATRPAQAIPLRLFGYHVNGSHQAVEAAQADGHGEMMDYKLSLTILAGPRRFCMIDGQFMAEGGQLSDGAKVLKVENRKVLIAMQERQKWIFAAPQTDPGGQEVQAPAQSRKGPS